MSIFRFCQGFFIFCFFSPCWIVISLFFQQKNNTKKKTLMLLPDRFYVIPFHGNSKKIFKFKLSFDAFMLIFAFIFANFKISKLFFLFFQPQGPLMSLYKLRWAFDILYFLFVLKQVKGKVLKVKLGEIFTTL